jgi:hypothetical protein
LRLGRLLHSWICWVIWLNQISRVNRLFLESTTPLRRGFLCLDLLSRLGLAGLTAAAVPGGEVLVLLPKEALEKPEQ